MNREERDELKARAEKALKKIRPYLVADGGDIAIVDLTEDMVLKVELKGACHGCPFSMQTLKAGVEMTVKNEVPEIREVVDVNNP
jgi:Fe-S cluster biogenesis protein NfuA